MSKTKTSDGGRISRGARGFAAGTPVLTKRGYVPIEKVGVGDQVLTHAGRYRLVLGVGISHDVPLVSVRSRGSLPIACARSQGIMARTRTRRYVNIRPVFEYGEVHECAAEDLVPNGCTNRRSAREARHT